MGGFWEFANRFEFQYVGLFLANPTLVFFATLITLIAVLGTAQGRTALLAGLTLLPIPIALTATTLHLIYVVSNGDTIQGTYLYHFAKALSPLFWSVIVMSLGFSFSGDIQKVGIQQKPRSNILIARDIVGISAFYVLWNLLIGRVYYGQFSWNFWDNNVMLLFGVAFAGFALITEKTNSISSLLGDCALKAGLACSVFSLIIYLWFLSFETPTQNLYEGLIFGWFSLLAASVIIVATNFMGVFRGDADLDKSIVRNWHLLEAFGFYIFLSSAPPTLFDLGVV